MDNSAPTKTARKCVRFLEAERGHRPPTADVGRAKSPLADVDLRMYVSVPQDQRTKETHAPKRTHQEYK